MIVKGDPVELETDDSLPPEIPKKLRDMLRLDDAAHPSWVDGFTGKLVPGAKGADQDEPVRHLAAGTAIADAEPPADAGGDPRA